MTRAIDDVLALVSSEDPADRVRAAEVLARFSGDRGDAALSRLLHDPADTAVAVAAAVALLARGDLAGAEVVLRFLGTGDDDAVDHVLDAIVTRWGDVEASGLRTRATSAFLSVDPVLVAGAREVRDAMGWWDGPPPPPATIDGWAVRLTADVREAIAADGGLHYVRDGYVSGIAHLVVADRPGEPGVAVLWCDHYWCVRGATTHFDLDLALSAVAFHFGPLRLRPLGGSAPLVARWGGGDGRA